MTGYNFSKKDCLKSLLAIGFQEQVKNKRRSPHKKYRPTESLLKNIDIQGQRPFIMIPNCSEKKFFLQNAVISQLKVLGGSKLVDEFLKHL